jgi:hypothetical protein
MFSYSTRMKLIPLYFLKAAPSKHPSSKHPPSKYQVSHALMACLFDPDPDPDPDQLALGRLHPGVS